MCGIAGIIGPQEDLWIEDMCNTMRHRGPNDQGIWRAPSHRLSLGHRRLSIIDLSGGAQPMEDTEGTTRIVYNGEIFNSPALRKQMEDDGIRFVTTNSDTETLLQLYKHYGEHAVEPLNGMFAYAIHDVRHNKVVLVRDRMGIKPLYYAHSGERFAFASELKALLRLPWVSREINPASLSHYLSMQFIPAPDSIFSSIHKLQAGHTLEYSLDTGKFEIRRYWQLAIQPNDKLDQHQWIEEIRDSLDNAITSWTLSDVPIACSLSGGLDSSYLATVLAGRGARVNTFTVGFLGANEEAYNELPLARKVAERIGADHHEIILDPSSLLDQLDSMVESLDEPYGGGLPSWFVYEALSKEYRVAMTGTGGDELFGNYSKWARYEYPEKQRWNVLLNQVGEQSCPRHAEYASKYPGGFFFHRYMTGVAKEAILTPELVSQAWATEALIEQIWNTADSTNHKDKTAFVDFTLQLPEEFLLVTDRFSMAHSVEARVPFLDHKLVETVFSVPATIRTQQGDPKYLLREITRKLLPQAIIDAPKRGFVIPMREWTRGPLAGRIRESLNPDRLRRQGLFTCALWDSIVHPHLKGEADFTQQVWTLFMFQLWYDRFVR